MNWRMGYRAFCEVINRKTPEEVETDFAGSLDSICGSSRVVVVHSVHKHRGLREYFHRIGKVLACAEIVPALVNAYIFVQPLSSPQVTK